MPTEVTNVGFAFLTSYIGFPFPSRIMFPSSSLTIKSINLPLEKSLKLSKATPESINRFRSVSKKEEGIRESLLGPVNGNLISNLQLSFLIQATD